MRNVDVTSERKPFIGGKSPKLQHAGTARANVAPTSESSYGTTENDWAGKKHSHQTVLQQHCDFFDRNHDGILWPQDTFIGFYRLGFGLILSLIAVLVIHPNFSYPTCPGWLPDPFFRIFLDNVHRDKHGSDTGTYDHEGRFVPQKFEDIFGKYADGRDYLTISDVGKVLFGQRCIADPIGWGGALFEWLAAYIMLWPQDGRMMKVGGAIMVVLAQRANDEQQDIRGIYDGSIFYTLAARRKEKL